MRRSKDRYREHPGHVRLAKMDALRVAAKHRKTNILKFKEAVKDLVPLTSSISSHTVEDIDHYDLDFGEERSWSSQVKDVCENYWRFIVSISLPILLMFIPIIGFKMSHPPEMDECNRGHSAAYCSGYTLLLMVSLWLIEIIPYAVTALIPVFSHPLFGIQTSEAVTSAYFSNPVLMMTGGMILALALEFCNLHKRIALRVNLWVGTTVNRLLLGVMLTTSFLSFFVANVPMAAMMVPVANATVDELEKCLEDSMKEEYEEVLRGIDAEFGEEEGQVEGSQRVSASSTSPGWSLNRREGGTPSTQHSSRESRTSSKVDDSQRHVALSELEWDRLERKLSADKFLQNVRVMLLLTVAYSTNIAGTGLLSGSGTNFIALKELGEVHLPVSHHGTRGHVTFLNWFALNFPVILINLVLCFGFLKFWFVWWKGREWEMKKIEVGHEQQQQQSERKSFSTEFHLTPEMTTKFKLQLEQSYKNLGQLSCHEIGVCVVFILTVLIWIFHEPVAIPGIRQLFWDVETGRQTTHLTTFSVMAILLLFIVPRNKDFYCASIQLDFRNVHFQPLLEWQFVHEKFPWSILLLLGGGLAMSDGVHESGLGTILGRWLDELTSVPKEVALLFSCFGISFFTEVSSNTAVAAIVTPILRHFAMHNCWHPLYLSLPAIVVSSYAFMLPVATPPNMIVFVASGMKISDMAKPGLVVNIMSTITLYIFTLSWGEIIFDFGKYDTPERCAVLEAIVNATRRRC